MAAEVIISAVLDRLVELIIRDSVVELITREVDSFVLREYRREVKELSNDLIYLMTFLKDAEERQYGDGDIHNWVSKIRELAYAIEDVLYMLHLKVRRKREFFTGEGSCGVFHLAIEMRKSGTHDMVKKYYMGKKIKKIRYGLRELLNRGQEYNLQDSDSAYPLQLRIDGEGRSDAFGRLRELIRSTSFAVKENVVGFEDEARILLSKLLDENQKLFIISIYGISGLGKTTLARKLYHNSDVRMRFSCYAWVYVPQDYTIQDLLLRVINSFKITTIKMEVLEKMNEEDLRQHLYESMQGLSYIVVIDNLWDKDVWKILNKAFPDNNNGSRVIITTRNEEVIEGSDGRTYCHGLRYLRPDESWKLFCEKCFKHYNVDVGMVELAQEMVQKCIGLPLAIIVLSELLSTKNPEDWPDVHNHLWQHLEDGVFGLHPLLVLNFNSLPYRLKSCFLYLSCFPKDFEIKIEKLIHLLVVEDFIPQVEDHTMEEVAKGYIDEFINKNLIQVGQRYWGRILTCRVHDIVRDLAIEKARSNFLDIYDKGNHSLISSCPRQVIYSNTESSLWLQKCNPCLRSLFLYGEYEFSVPMCKRFSFLKVLVDVSISNDYVTRKSIRLKYLGLKDSFIFLSPSIDFYLPRLQTLDVPRSVFPVNLPAEICESQELRHLIGNFSCVPSSIESLTELQTLRSITNRAWTEIETEKLVNLRELWLGGPLKGSQVFLFDSMANLTSLRILSVELGHDDSFGSLEPLSCCQHLVELRLRGKMESLPEDIIGVLPNLECLSLRDSRLRDDPMPLLEKLPKLTILHLGYRFYSRKKIMCSANGFPLLEILLFDEHKFQIEEWQVEEGALPRLQGLRIPEKFKLTIPERLRSLPTPDPREYTTKPPDDVDQYQV